MRISNHRFAIETGRFRKIPRDERCCLFCKEQDLESGDQLNYLLNSDGPIVKAVARFFYLANLMHSSVNMN